MKARYLTLAAVALATGAATPSAPAFLSAPAYAQEAGLKEGGAPIAFEAKDLEGKALNLKQYKGKVVLIDFWATWCGPCVREVPSLVQAYNDLEKLGFDIVGISLDRSRAPLEKFIAEKQMPWRQVFDADSKEKGVADLYGIEAIPSTVLIGRDGRVVALDLRGAKLRKAIENALAE